MENDIKWMQEIGPEDLETVGRELLLLADLLREEYPVLPGFVVLPAAYATFLDENGLPRKGGGGLDGWGDLAPEERAGRLTDLRKALLEAEVDPSLETGVRNAVRRLQEEEGAQGPMPLTIRPLLLPEVPGPPVFSEPFDLLLNVRDEDRFASAIRQGWSHAWTDAFFDQCRAARQDPFSVRVLLLVQRFVSPGVAGVFFPGDALDSMKPERVIDACWGMGEAVSSGRFDVDRFVLQCDPLVLLEQNVGNKEKKLIPCSDGSPGIQEVEVPEDLAEMPCLSWDQIQDIAETGRAVEGLAGRLLGLHWAFEDGELLILRAAAFSGAGERESRPVETGAGEAGVPEMEADEADVPEAEDLPGNAGEKDPLEAQEAREPGGRQPQAETGDVPESPGDGKDVSAGQAPVSPGKDPPEEVAGDAAEDTPPGESAGPGSKTVEGPKAVDPAPAVWRFPAERFPGWKLGLRDRARARALTALFRSARRLKRQGGAIRERDEFSHRHTDSRYWNESYYFNFSDPGNGIGGFTRIGMVPNQDMAIGILYLFLPDGGILMLTQTEPCRASRDTVAAGLLRYERELPLWTWRVRFQGNMLHVPDPSELPSLLTASPEEMAGRDLAFKDVSVDLHFRGRSPCHDFKAADPRFIAERIAARSSRLRDFQAVTRVASEHYEQVGTWSGEIVLDGAVMTVAGSGHRDHSWGDRDWKAVRKWTWLTAQFGEEFGFNLSRVMIESLDLFNGYICRSGKNYPLRRAWLDTEFEADGVTQKRVLLRLQDTEGWEAEIEGRPRTVVPLILQEDAHRTLVNEAFTEYRWKGRTGFGIAEYLHQLGAS